MNHNKNKNYHYQEYLKIKQQYLQIKNYKNYNKNGGYKPKYYFTTDDNVIIQYKIKSPDKIGSDDFTTNIKKSDKTKIFLINSIESFDNFTKKYAKISSDKKRFYLKWYEIKNDYKGFYLDKSIQDLNMRRKYEMSHWMFEKVFDSWWIHEVNGINGVIIFV